jgi:DNA-binding transcriptional LysR family regulator
MRVMIAVAEAGTVAEAAARLGVSRAKVRRKVAMVEAETGAQLLVRVDGLLTPTRQGQAFLEGAARLLEEAKLLVTHTREIGHEPAGLLRLALHPGFPHRLSMASIMLQRKRYPRLRQLIRIAEDPVSLLPTHADVATLISEDLELPNFECTPIAALRYGLVASEAYFAEHGRPENVRELVNHTLLTWHPPSGDGSALHCSDGNKIAIEPVISCSNERYLLFLASSGVGIAYVPLPPIFEPEFAKLVPVFEEEIGRSINVQLVVPNILAEIPRVKVMRDTLLGILADG